VSENPTAKCAVFRPQISINPDFCRRNNLLANAFGGFYLRAIFLGADVGLRPDVKVKERK
jgi:hypothetical protein